MKKFTTEEIRDLYNRFCREEISFSRMVEMLNERVSDAENLCIEDILSYKKGDVLVKEYKDGGQYIFILDYIDDKGLIYYHCYYGNKFNTTCVKDDFGIGEIGDSYHKRLRYATDSEKELLIAELYKVGKRWNEERKCVEDIPEKPKKGDLAIFWDEDERYAAIRIYDRPNESEEYFRHKDKIGNVWANAIKFESKEQYERLIRGEI